MSNIEEYYENKSTKKTTGVVNIVLPGIHVDAYFSEGKLKKGQLTINNYLYDGNFNEKGYLDGEGSIKIGNWEYRGMYKNGELLEGSTYVDGKLTESGVYTYVGHVKKPHLYSGTKWKQHYTEAGLFDNFGNLLRGTIVHENGDRYTGIFENKRLIDGDVECKIKDQIFSASYKLRYDPIIRTEIFESCEIKWNGLLSELPAKFLAMVCCQGKSSSCAHKFFLHYLYEYDGKTICYLQKALFNTLTALEDISLSIILENLSKYPDYKYAKYADLLCKQKLRRSVSAS